MWGLYSLSTPLTNVIGNAGEIDDNMTVDTWWHWEFKDADDAQNALECWLKRWRWWPDWWPDASFFGLNWYNSRGSIILSIYSCTSFHMCIALPLCAFLKNGYYWWNFRCEKNYCEICFVRNMILFATFLLKYQNVGSPSPWNNGGR